MTSGIDIVMEIRRLLNVPSIQALLGVGKVWQHNRPRNSMFPDIVVSIPEFASGAFNSGYVDVNLHAPNLKAYYPIPEVGEDTTFPDLATLKALTDAVLPLIQSTSGFALSANIAGKPIRDKDGEWYVNIRVAFESIDVDRGTDVVLVEETSLANGYGGVSVSLADVWTGKGVILNIRKGSQLNINVGRYEFNQINDWLLPFESNPKKNNQIRTTEGEYVINGIIPLNGFWQLSTVRKDG